MSDNVCDRGDDGHGHDRDDRGHDRDRGRDDRGHDAHGDRVLPHHFLSPVTSLHRFMLSAYQKALCQQ